MKLQNTCFMYQLLIKIIWSLAGVKMRNNSNTWHITLNHDIFDKTEAKMLKLYVTN